MSIKFQFIVRKLLQFTRLKPAPLVDQAAAALDRAFPADQPVIYRGINSAFLIVLAGEQQPGYADAKALLDRTASLPAWKVVSRFYTDLGKRLGQELDRIASQDQAVHQRIESLCSWLEGDPGDQDQNQVLEGFWSLFHPEAAGIWGHADERVAELRQKRTVTIIGPNPTPIQDPARQVLFTANALLTTPPPTTPLDSLSVSAALRQQLLEISQEPQRYWYDHPLPVGTPPEANEVLYGLRGLQDSLDYEKAQGTTHPEAQLTCLLSISVTHAGLQDIARRYLAEELQRSGQFPGLKIVTFTERDTSQLVEQVLLPAARHYLGQEHSQDDLQVFGVDGEYGRHYSFLKAIAALWSVLVDPQVKATFKIDLDQVFPQQALKAQTGASAFEHFRTPLWGAKARDIFGEPVELGMIAGALVNEADISRGLFTPDVPFPPPSRQPAPDEWVFFSQLPQALSTRAEMMARYDTASLDGVHSCLQRVHVTGGTNGILVDSLRRYRPFTPSFIGRAEDQAYILSALASQRAQLAYLHQPGLIMRHDKAAFAQDAMQAARVGKLVGDYVRILVFSAYARALPDSIQAIKNRLDPFTGSFISYLPVTLTALRFALKAEALFSEGQPDLGAEFIHLGTRRLGQALEFAYGEIGGLARQHQLEKQGWGLYYDILAALESALEASDPFALELQRRTRQLVSGFAIQ